MNLRDKLRSIHSQPGIKKPEPALSRGDCWRRVELRPLTDFPGAFELRRDTVALLEEEPLPETLDPGRILYLDTETTGLSGGAGTVAFEVGFGQLTDEGFRVTQLVMRDYPEERYLLEHVAEALRDCDVICTFNGRSFDIPLLRDRFLMNRIPAGDLEKPHIDLLHIARRMWKLRLGRCNLTRLEEAILGRPRENDLPGSEAPARFFAYLRTGDFSGLEEVLRHNAQDIASLCQLLNRMAWLCEHPERQPHPEDVYSLGMALEKGRHREEARRCYRLCSGSRYRVKGQLRLARDHQRAGEQQEAVRLWLDMMDRREGGIEPCISLAKYYEHTLRDIPAAIRATERALELLAEPSLEESGTVQQQKIDVQYRYGRLLRKQARAKERNSSGFRTESNDGRQ